MYRKYIDKLRSYRLTFIFGVAVLVLFVILLAALLAFGETSIQRARAARDELFVRDLRDLVGMFDTDEKYVLEKNLRSLTTEEREIAPLLVPRQYYVALPSGRQTLTPRAPPRNCYVELLPKNGIELKTAQQQDRFCAYFTNDRTLGRYMFFNMTFSDQTLVPLTRGDIRFNADGLRLSIRDGGATKQWWVFLQTPSKQVASSQYELTAFQELSDGRRELDRRIEGWAYVTRQLSGPPIVTLLARMDYRATRDQDTNSSDDPEAWPPIGWNTIRIALARRDAVSSLDAASNIEYLSVGKIGLSLAVRAAPIFDSHARLFVGRKTEDREDIEYAELAQKTANKGGSAADSGPMFLPGGDILVKRNPLTRAERLTDTNLFLEVRHPGTIVERALWQSILLIAGLLVVFLVLSSYSYFRLIRPIWMMSRVMQRREAPSSRFETDITLEISVLKRWRLKAINAIFAWILPPIVSILEDKSCAAESDKLPYSGRNDEIGVLASGFNALLEETRRQAASEQERARDRESTLRYIRHEVNNSLTVLLNSDPSTERRQKLLEKISYYFNKLDDRSGPEMLPMHRKICDIAPLIKGMVAEAGMTDPCIDYVGPVSGVNCDVDPFVLQQALENVFINATEHRTLNTNIVVSLELSEGNLALVHVTNQGLLIPEEMLKEIFDRFVTTSHNGHENGRGMGLYNSRVYIKRMDGDIRAFNNKDGVTLEIALALADASRTAAASIHC